MDVVTPTALLLVICRFLMSHENFMIFSGQCSKLDKIEFEALQGNAILLIVEVRPASA